MKYEENAWGEAENILMMGMIAPSSDDVECIIGKLRETWEEGYRRGYADRSAGWAETPQATNPYEEKP